MSGRPRIARHFPLLLALALGASIAAGSAADVPAAEKQEEAKPKISFPPNLEARLVKFLAKLKEAKRKLLEERMRKEVEDIAKTTGLDPEGVKALETSAQEVSDICLEDWIDKTGEMFRRELRQPVNVLAQILDQMIMQAELYANQDALEGYIRPMDHARWTAALKRTLSAEQAAAWEKVQKERAAAFEKEMGEYLKMVTDTTREQFTKIILAASADAQRSLGLSKERGTELDRVAGTVAEKCAEEWRKRVEKMFLQMEVKQRQQLLKSRQFFVGFEPNERPDRQDAWNQGLARILSPEEFKRLEAAREERRSRRMRAIGMLMVVEFDDQAAFTSIQRQRLQPIVTRMVTEASSLFPDDAPEYSLSFSQQAFLAAGARAKEQEMKEILDPVQWRHWQEICHLKISGGDGEEDAEPEATPAGAGAASNGIAEPEDLETAFSDFLYEKTMKERSRMLSAMVLKAEDAGRVAGLGEDAIGRLETAARGAADKTLGDWKANADQWIRSMVRDATAQNIRQRLKGIQSYNLPRDNNLTPDKEMIWTAVVKAELTAAQMAEWTKAVEERSAFRNRAVALASLAEFDLRIPLAPEQWAKLEPLVIATVNEYSAEISTMFGNPNSAKWYLLPYSIFIPFAAVSDKDLKEILGKEQWDRWAENPEFINSKNYWTNLQQNHAMRVKMMRR